MCTVLRIPVLNAVTGALLTGNPTACVLMGRRNPRQVAAAAQAGEALSSADAEWVRGRPRLIISAMSRRSDITVRQYALGEEPEYDPHTMALSPGERIEMVWQITKDAWAFKEPSFRESRLRRDVARVVRRRR